MKNPIVEVGETIEITAAANLSAGDIVKIGASSQHARVVTDLLTGETGAALMGVQAVVMRVPKENTTDVYAQGDAVNFNASTQQAETLAPNQGGIAHKPSSATDTTVDVMIGLT